MARQIRWSILASDQFEETLSYWNRHNGNNSYSSYLLTQSINATKLVSKYPHIGRMTDQLLVRRILIDRKYAIYYSYDDDVIDGKLWRPLRMNPKTNVFE